MPIFFLEDWVYLLPRYDRRGSSAYRTDMYHPWRSSTSYRVWAEVFTFAVAIALTPYKARNPGIPRGTFQCHFGPPRKCPPMSMKWSEKCRFGAFTYGTAQPRPRPFLSSSRGAPFFIFGVPPDDAPNALSTQWNTEKPQRFFIWCAIKCRFGVGHQMQNFFGKLWLWLCLGRPWAFKCTFRVDHPEMCGEVAECRVPSAEVHGPIVQTFESAKDRSTCCCFAQSMILISQ